MGLDMYLYLRKSDYASGAEWRSKEEQERAKYPVELAKFEEDIKKHSVPSKCVYIDYKVGYWRKANAVHGWFVENCQEGNDDCKDYYVSKEQAQDLLDLCNQVIADHSLAQEKLPTQSGFFFGSQEYNEYYFEDIVYTKELLEKVIAFLETEEGKEYQIIYSSSW